MLTFEKILAIFTGKIAMLTSEIIFSLRGIDLTDFRYLIFVLSKQHQHIMIKVLTILLLRNVAVIIMSGSLGSPGAPLPLLAWLLCYISKCKDLPLLEPGT